MKSSNYPEISHEILLIQRDDEIIIALPNGKEIANITVCTMETDILNGNEYKTVPTKNFWVCFNPKEYSTGKDLAEAVVDPK
jgi:hypothetical protein